VLLYLFKMTKDQKLMFSIPFFTLGYLFCVSQIGIPESFITLAIQFVMGLTFITYLFFLGQWFSNPNRTRPRIDYLLKEGFISLILKDDKIVGVDSSLSPWQIIISRHDTTFYVWYPVQEHHKITLSGLDRVDEF
jgi:hypothetical protein